MEILLILFLQFVLIVSTVVFIFIYGSSMLSEGYQVPLVKTPRAYLPAIAAALRVGPGDVVYDLGSGDGRIILTLARQFPDARFVGIERNPLLAAYSNLKARRLKNASFQCADMFETDLSDATSIYAYLKTKPLNELHSQRKLGNVRLVSRAFKLAGMNADSIVELSQTPGPHGEHLLHVYEL